MTPPNLLQPGLGGSWKLFKLAAAFHKLGPDMAEAVEILTGPARPILDRWFESEELKATLATDAIIGAFAAPSMPGTAYVLFHHVMGEEGELGVEGKLAHVADGVSFDVQVGSGIAAHRREGAVFDPVPANDHIGRAKDVDAVAVLTRAARTIADVGNAVVDDNGAVVAARGAPDLDAVIAGAIDKVTRDHKTAGVDDVNRCVATPLTAFSLISPATEMHTRPLRPDP